MDGSRGNKGWVPRHGGNGDLGRVVVPVGHIQERECLMKGFIMITTADAVVATGGGLMAVSGCDQLPAGRKVTVGAYIVHSGKPAMNRGRRGNNMEDIHCSFR